MPSIAELPQRLAVLDEASRALAEELFRVEELEGAQEVPEPLRCKAARWCSGGGDTAPEAWRRIEQQRVIAVHALWTFESANFNPLRACRPVSGTAKGSAGPDEVADAC